MRKQYRVKMGRHLEGKRIYEKGDIVITEKDFSKLFPQKFEDLGPAPEDSPPVMTPPPPPPPLPPPPPEKVPLESKDAHEEETTVDPPTKPAKKKASKRGKVKEDDSWDND